jgi:hypothetical protein
MGAPDISGNSIRLAAVLMTALRPPHRNRKFFQIDLVRQAPTTSAGMAAASWLRDNVFWSGETPM